MDSIDHYDIETSTDGVEWTTIASVAPGTTNYTDPAPPKTTPYYYRIVAVTANGVRIPSNAVKVSNSER